MIINQIKNIKKKVTELLIEKPHLRDDDNKLIANIWNKEIGKDHQGNLTCRSMSTFDFLMNFSSGKYTHPGSIIRCRQKVQEQNENLRGLSYTKRKISGEEFRKESHKI